MRVFLPRQAQLYAMVMCSYASPKFPMPLLFLYRLLSCQAGKPFQRLEMAQEASLSGSETFITGLEQHATLELYS